MRVCRRLWRVPPSRACVPLSTSRRPLISLPASMATPRHTGAPRPAQAACASWMRMRAPSCACRCGIVGRSVWRTECERPPRRLEQDDDRTRAALPRNPRAAASASAGKSARTQLTRTSASVRFRAARQIYRPRDDINAPPCAAFISPQVASARVSDRRIPR
ncbi:hypothetical protein DFH09DRAFT_1284674 [Mycena vulgaris]|nr:hypothetical protein DFH09DRAFT_1284674 [Mycena vulgaris]